MIHTHDGPMHIARIPAYLNALTGGQILPRWAGTLNYGYGMPLFNFYYHMPYLLGSLFVSFGLSLTLTFKILLFLSYALSGVFMYMFLLAFFKDVKKAWVATVLYQFAPFHLVDLIVRGDIGETLAMAFLPLVLYFVVRVFSSGQPRRFIIATGFAASFMILSHSAIGLIYFGTATLFACIFAPNALKRWQALLGLGTGLLLSAFFWIPIVFERRYTYGDFFMKDMYKTHFAPVINFFIPNLTNSPALQNGGVDVSFGLMQTIGIFIALWLLITKRLQKFEKLVTYFCLGLSAIALFAMISPSSFLWAHISILRAFQFPWRMLTVTVFGLSLLGAAVFTNKTTSVYLFIGIIAVSMLSSVVYWQPPLGFDHIDENYYRHYPLDTTFFGETNLVWSAGPEGSYPKAPVELIAGKGSVSDIKKSETLHAFVVTAQTQVQVMDNTQYYPGWRVYSDGQKIPIEFQDQNHRGLITFRLNPGTHYVTVSFGETPDRQVADGITWVSAISLTVLLFFPIVKKKHV